MQPIFTIATKGDILLIQQLARTIWHSHYPGIITVEQIEYMLEKMYSAHVIANEMDNGAKWVIIFDGLQPIGFISFQFEDFENKCKLSKLYVLTNYHGKGIGQAALMYVKQQSEILNAKMLYLTVNKNNTKAIEAYKKAGFVVEREVVADIGNGYVMDDYIMSTKIRPENQALE